MPYELGQRVYFPKGYCPHEDMPGIPALQRGIIEGESSLVPGVFYVRLYHGKLNGQVWNVYRGHFEPLIPATELQLSVQDAVEVAVNAGMTPDMINEALVRAGCSGKITGWAGHEAAQVASDAAAVIRFFLKHDRLAEGNEQFPNRECAEMSADALEKIAEAVDKPEVTG